MTPSFLDSVLRGAEALAARDPVGTLPDPELLGRFAHDRDPAAFAVLVRRHGPLVWGVCRNMLPADSDAEDAFQATFLALVRSAATIRRTDALGGWLHGVAYRVAMKARRAAARRKRREAIAASSELDSPVSDAAWDELQAAVHEEVCKLPEKLRLPFVLCGLQGRPQKDAAKQLGWTVGTLSGRLSVARQRLLDRLARRGVPVGVAAGAAVLGATSGNASVPSSLAIKALAAAQSPDSISPVVTNLARGVTHMYLTRTKMLVASLVVAGLLTTGIGTRHMSTADAQDKSRRDAEAEQLKKAIEFLRAHQATTRDRWEYKFVPVKSSVDPTDLKKMLIAHDREGWDYCGSQNLLVGGTSVTHLTFKRPAGVASGKPVDPATALEALAREMQKEDKDEARKQFLEAARDYYQRAGQEQQSKFNESLLQNMKDAEAARKAEQEAREHAEWVRNHAAEAETRAKAGAVLKTEDLARQIEKMRADQEKLLLKIKELEKQKSEAPTKAAADQGNIVVTLRHARAADVVKILGKMLPEPAIASVDESKNSISLRFPADTPMIKVKDILEKINAIDDASSVSPATRDKFAIVVVPLKHIDGKSAAATINKMIATNRLQVTTEPTTNSVILAGPAEVLQGLRKIIEELDASGKPK